MARILPQISALAPYSPGLSIAEIQERHNLATVIKLASNENPLGASPLAQEAIRRNAGLAFRYPQGGNPRLVRALAARHGADPGTVILGNGSDEIIDLLVRITAQPGRHNIVCFEPCFSIYPIQAQIQAVETRRQPLNPDFSFDFGSLASLVDSDTRLVFITTPDNPSGYCPQPAEVLDFARRLALDAPDALLVIDEAYMDFHENEAEASLLARGQLPPNALALRTFSKSHGLAGLRIGYGIAPANIASGFWRARLPFSLNILAEEAALAALGDEAFREATLAAVKSGREALAAGLRKLGCLVFPSQANFLMFRLPDGFSANDCFESLLAQGIIIRPLKSYALPDYLRVSVGSDRENRLFLAAMADFLAGNENARNHN